MFEGLFTTNGMIGLVTLVLMEIVLGIDNIIFIAILCGFLPGKEQQRKARTVGLSLAMILRVLLLIGIYWLVHISKTLFFVASFAINAQDLIFFCGGVFLIYKTSQEIYLKLKGNDPDHKPKERKLSVRQAIIQITLIDIVFSFDSILTAVGLSGQKGIMITAVVTSMFVMLFFAKYVTDFINKFPTIKMLALAFLVSIGLLLVLQGFHIYVDKGYIYSALVFSLIVELLNIRLRGNKKAH